MRKASFVAVLSLQWGPSLGHLYGLPHREIDSRVEGSEQLPRYKAGHSSLTELLQSSFLLGQSLNCSPLVNVNV
jgi:hypothetical protein